MKEMSLYPHVKRSKGLRDSKFVKYLLKIVGILRFCDFVIFLVVAIL